jgi:hypothetical protein
VGNSKSERSTSVPTVNCFAISAATCCSGRGPVSTACKAYCSQYKQSTVNSQLL